MKAPKMDGRRGFLTNVAVNACQELATLRSHSLSHTWTHPTNRSASYSVFGVCTVHGVHAQLANKYVVLMVTMRNSDRMS